jgi:uncharacterized membrane protein YraQ (UPF0718 family)
MSFLLDILVETGKILAQSSLYLLFGFFLAGLIHVFLPEKKVTKYLGKRSFRSVFNAGLLGVPLPLCSCSVVPTAVALRKNGASRGSTMSFLISTPETGVDSIGISLALLDPLLTIFRPLAAFITAITAGLAANFLEKNSPPEALPLNNNSNTHSSGACCCHNGELQKKAKNGKLRLALRYSFGELLNDLAGWLVIGLIAAAMISILIPEDFFTGTQLGRGFWPMLLMLLVGIPLYICATASTPIAAALILKGLSPGAALVFLLAGPATNIGALLMLSKYFERKFIILYLVTISVMSLALGGLLNLIYSIFAINVRATLGSAQEFIPAWAELAGAIVLSLLILRSLIVTRADRKVLQFCQQKTRWLAGRK